MNWGFICLVGILLFAIITTISLLNFARRGDADALQDMSVVKRMKAQATVIGRVRNAIKDPMRRDNEKYEELAKIMEELRAEENEKG